MRRWILGSHNTLALQYALDDIAHGKAVVFIDPDGKPTDTILSLIPQERREDVLLFDPSDYEYPIAWNPLYDVPENQRAHVASLLLDAFRAANKYTHLSTPDFNLTLYSSIAALLDAPEGTLLGIPFMLTSLGYRAKVTKHVKDPMVKQIWNTFEEIKKRDRDQIIKSTRTNMTLLMADPRIRNILGQPQSAFSLKQTKILLARLPTAKLGKVKVNLLGSLFLAQLLAHETTASVYILDVHRFDGSAIIDASETLNVTVANSYLGELSRELQSALFGNMDERVIFRVGIEDSERLQRTMPIDQIHPKPHELEYLRAVVFDEHRQIYEEYPLISAGKDALKVANLSRLTYATPRKDVEKKLERFMRGM